MKKNSMKELSHKGLSKKSFDLRYKIAPKFEFRKLMQL